MARREIQNPMDQGLMWYKLTCLGTKVPAISHPALREESREEAKPKGHLLCHMPKNTFCKPCRQAKTLKPSSRASGGAMHIEAEKFAEHLAADFLIASTEDETGLEGEQVAMVFKDVAANFMYIYPSGQRTARDVIITSFDTLRRRYGCQAVDACNYTIS